MPFSTAPRLHGSTPPVSFSLPLQIKLNYIQKRIPFKLYLCFQKNTLLSYKITLHKVMKFEIVNETSIWFRGIFENGRVVKGKVDGYFII